MVRAALVLALLAAPAAADPLPADLELAKAHYRTGEIEYEQGRFHEAAHEFEEAFRLSGRAELLYNMGKAYDSAGDPARALGAYRRFLAANTSSSDRPFAESRVKALEQTVGRLRIRASVSGAAVQLDGAALGTTPLPEAPIELNPGRHAVTVSADGYTTFRASPDITLGGLTTIDAKLEERVKLVRVETRERATPVYRRWWLWTAVGAVAAAGVVTGAVLGARAASGVSGPSAQFPEVKLP